MHEAEICRRLRKLEDEIERKRRVIGRLKGRGLDISKEQQQLAQLLSEVEEALKSSMMWRAA